jgi:hypothetical protein
MTVSEPILGPRGSAHESHPPGIDRPTVQLPDRLWQNEKRYKPFFKNFLWQTLLRVALFFRLRLSLAKMK